MGGNVVEIIFCYLVNAPAPIVNLELLRQHGVGIGGPNSEIRPWP
jgi:hypothetical protein